MKPMVERRRSIEDVVGTMAGRMGTLLEQREQQGATDTVPDALRFWVAVDPLLAHLFKQMQDAAENQDRIAKARGTKDPMTVVGTAMAESARAAFQTRLLELRRDEEASALVAVLKRRATEIENDERVEEERAKSAAFWRQFATAPVSRGEEDSNDKMWMVLIALMVLQQTTRCAQMTMSAAAAFSRVTQWRQPDLTAQFAGC